MWVALQEAMNALEREDPLIEGVRLILSGVYCGQGPRIFVRLD